MAKSKVNICWLGRKINKEYVCFIPFTIDGRGKSVDQSLLNLEKEAIKIVKAVGAARPKIKCNFDIQVIKEAVQQSRNKYMKAGQKEN